MSKAVKMLRLAGLAAGMGAESWGRALTIFTDSTAELTQRAPRVGRPRAVMLWATSICAGNSHGAEEPSAVCGF